MMVLPGGQPGTNNLNADQRIHALLKRFNQADKWLGAICAAPMVLAHVGLLEGVSVSCYPGALKPL